MFIFLTDMYIGKTYFLGSQASSIMTELTIEGEKVNCAFFKPIIPRIFTQNPG